MPQVSPQKPLHGPCMSTRDLCAFACSALGMLIFCILDNCSCLHRINTSGIPCLIAFYALKVQADYPTSNVEYFLGPSEPCPSTANVIPACEVLALSQMLPMKVGKKQKTVNSNGWGKCKSQPVSFFKKKLLLPLL